MGKPTWRPRTACCRPRSLCTASRHLADHLRSNFEGGLAICSLVARQSMAAQRVPGRDPGAGPSPLNAWPRGKYLALAIVRIQAAIALAGSPATMDSQDFAQAMQASAHRLISTSSPIARQESAHCRQMRAQAQHVSKCTGVRRSRLSALARQISAHATSNVTCTRSACWPPIARQWLKVSRHVS